MSKEELLAQTEQAIRGYLSGDLDFSAAFNRAESALVRAGRLIGDQLFPLVGVLEDINAIALDRKRSLTDEEVKEIEGNLREALKVIDDIKEGRRPGLLKSDR